MAPIHEPGQVKQRGPLTPADLWEVVIPQPIYLQ
jgi:hypothetical protein